MFTSLKKTLSLLTACATLLSVATVARADFSVTVTDNFAGQGPFLRWDRFSTDLTATIHDAPVTNTETTVTGPTYSWLVNSQSPATPSFANPIDSGNGSATLNSPDPSKTICFVKDGGTYDIKVKCIVTYTSTDNNTGQQTPIVASGVTDVTFFVRVPIQVLSYGSPLTVPLRGDMMEFHDGGPTPAPAYGQVTAFNMKVYDNQKPQASSYGNGVIVEEFSKPFDSSGLPYEPNGPDGGDSWYLDLTNGTGTSTDYFPDGSGAWVRTPPASYTSLAATYQQTWHCMELTPPYNVQGADLYVDPGRWGVNNLGKPPFYVYLSNVNNTTLNTQSLSVYLDQTTRQ